MKNKKAFTLVELIVIIMIIGILSTIAVINMTTIFSDSRNSKRISDLSNISIGLENQKTKNGILALPGSYNNITNSGTIIKQGFFNKNVNILEITNIPTDPLIKTNYYNYSTTSNRLFYQLRASIEIETIEIGLKSYVIGNYKQIHKNIPSLIIANIANNDFDLSTTSGAFIVQNSTLNLPYIDDGSYYSGTTDLSEITSELGVEIPKYTGFESCEEIIENNRYMGPGEYYGSGSIVCND